VAAIEEAKDLNTLSVEDLVSSLKVHEIGLNEHELAKKVKSIALPWLRCILLLLLTKQWLLVFY